MVPVEVRRTTFRSCAAFTSSCKPPLNKLAQLGITKTLAEQQTPNLQERDAEEGIRKRSYFCRYCLSEPQKQGAGEG